MRSLAVAGLCLIAATAVCVIGSLIDSPRLSSVAWALGAGTAFAGAATGYGAITGSARRGGLPATGLALLGVAASLWIVEATLRITVGGGGLVNRVLPVLAAVASGVGFAVVAVATWRARLVRPAIGRVLAATAILGALAADPAVPYVLGAAPLGIGLLLAGKQRTTRREQTQMRSVYKVLAYIVAAEVVIQAMAMVYAVAGEGKWVMEGGVLDKAVIESREFVFPEVLGYAIHGINGMMIIPLIALLLLIFSFFAKVPGGVKWAGLVLLLVVVQVMLGLIGHGIPAVGALHGLNALLLFSAAIYTGHRVRRAPATPTADSPERVATPA